MNGLKAYLTSQFSFRAKTMDESGNRHSSENVHGFKKWSKSTEHILHIPSIKSLLFSKSTEKIRVSTDQLPDGATNLRFPTPSGGLSPVVASGYTKKRSARPMRLRSLKTTIAMREKSKNWIPKLYFASMDSLSCRTVTEREGKGIYMASTPIPQSTTLVTDVHTDAKSSECLISTSGMSRSNEKSFVRSASSKSAGFQVDKPGQLFNTQSKDASSPCVVTSEKHTSDTDTDGLLGFINPEPPSDINIAIKCVLGTGSNGFCYEVELRGLTNTDATAKLSCFAVNQRNSSLPRRAALKVIPQMIYDRKKSAIRREIFIQRQLRHSNLLQLFLAYRDLHLKAACLLLELCALGSVLDLVNAGRMSKSYAPDSSYQDRRFKDIRSDVIRMPSKLIYNPMTGGIPETLASFIFTGLVNGLKYLHEKIGVVHRDVKPANVLLAEGFVAKLSDFGLACSQEHCVTHKEQICGSPNYLAPEVYLKEGHSTRSDCWAAGATLYFMLCGIPPFQSAEAGDNDSPPVRLNSPFGCETQLRSVPSALSSIQVRSICRALLWGRYSFPRGLQWPARQTVESLLQRQPHLRATAAEVMRMEFCTHHRAKCSSSESAYEPTEVKLQGCQHDLFAVNTLNGVQVTKLPNWLPKASDEFTATSAAVHFKSINPHLEHEFSESINPTKGVAYTGKEAVYDIFKLLSNRVKRPSKQLESKQICILHWVSRWALTKHPFLYYTLDKVKLMRSGEKAVVPYKDLCVGQPMGKGDECWGVTNRSGQGLIQTKGKRLHQVGTDSFLFPDPIPTLFDVRTHCEFLVRRLNPFDPVTSRQSQQPDGHQADEDKYVHDNQPPVFVQRWKDHGNNLLFFFSTGGWQVNFYNHSKLIVHYPYILVHRDSIGDEETTISRYHLSIDYEALEKEFRAWVASHGHLRSILQILLFTLL